MGKFSYEPTVTTKNVLRTKAFSARQYFYLRKFRKAIRSRYVHLVDNDGVLDLGRVGLGDWDRLYTMGLSFLRFRGTSSVLSTFSVLQFSLFSSLAPFGLPSSASSSSVPSVIRNAPLLSISLCAGVYDASLCVASSASSSSSFTCEYVAHRAFRMRGRIKPGRLERRNFTRIRQDGTAPALARGVKRREHALFFLLNILFLISCPLATAVFTDKVYRN